MATESGFSNQKKLGQAQYKTIQPLGSSKFGAPTSPRGVFDVSGADQAIVNADVSTDEKYIYIEITGHNARVDDVVRIIDGTISSWEFNIEEIVDVDVFKVLNTSPTLPQIADNARIMRWITPQYSDDGGLTVSVPTAPAQFVYNGGNQQVVQSTATPANNRGLPSLLFIYKDGVEQPITKDTGTPANTLGIPVEIVAASGTPINITAGDINVQLTDVGVNFDSVRVGDGSGNYIGVNASGEATVHDADVKAQLVTLNGKDFATSAKQDSLLAELQLKADLTETQPVSLASVPLPTGAATSAKQDAEAVLVGAVTETAPASDTASSGLNGRLQRIAQRLTSMIALLPASLGQKTMANSLAVTLASDQSALSTTPTALVGSYQQDLTVSDAAVETFTAPLGSKWVLLQADELNTGNIRVKIGAAATTTSGMVLQPGRDMKLDCGGDVSYTSEVGGSGKLYAQFGA